MSPSVLLAHHEPLPPPHIGGGLILMPRALRGGSILDSATWAVLSEGEILLTDSGIRVHAS